MTDTLEIYQLKEALENQIDVVLRLEEERLLLLKENKLQKEKIKELSDTVTKYTSFPTAKKSKSVQTENKAKITSEIEIQTDQIELVVPVVNSNKVLENNNDAKTVTEKKESLSSMSNIQIAKDLLLSEKKFLKDSSLALENSFISINSKESKDKATLNSRKRVLEKENKSPNTGTKEIYSQKTKENEILAQELVNMTKEINNLKCQNRSLLDSVKRLEKDNAEFQRQVEIKKDNFDKLKKEISDMSVLLNTEKYKSIKSLELEKNKYFQQYKLAEKEKKGLELEKIELQNELEKFKTCLKQLTLDYDNLSFSLKEEKSTKEKPTEENPLQEKTITGDTLLREAETKLKEREEEVESMKYYSAELLAKMETMEQETNNLKSYVKTLKAHTEAAMKDVEFYRVKLNLK